MKASEMVRKFHEKIGVPILASPTIPAEDRRQLRIDLIQEEFEEFVKASQRGDIVGVADALADIDYVVHGAAHEWGIPLDPIMEEVHRSNMTKVWPDGTIHRREDGKILKPPTYSPANIEAVLKGNQ